MKIEELHASVKRAGGGGNALDYADALLEKINRLESTKRYPVLIKQLTSAGQPGDFRGRVLEVNFADLFVKQNLELHYGAKQGGKGDVDFCWRVADLDVFVEMKLLGQDQATRDSINQQIAVVGVSSTLITDDTRDIARIQFDLFQKSSNTKFNTKPEKTWINLIGIDVSELQLGMADLCDCILAAGGNTVASKHCDEAALRQDVVGIFEKSEVLSDKQKEWVERVHKVPQNASHPRDYIHGALFLFREPAETAALSYSLSGAIVWNPAIVSEEVAKPIAVALAKIVPPAKK